MTEEKIVDRIAKLLRKAHGTNNDAEAQAFAAKASELALRHKLEIGDIEWNTEASQKIRAVDFSIWQPGDHNLPYKRSRIAWAELLATVVAEAHSCVICVFSGSNIIQFIGTAEDRAISMQIFAYLVREGERLSLKAYDQYYYQCEKWGDTGPARGYRASWLSGFVHGVFLQLRRLQKQLEAEYAESTALIRLKDALTLAEEFRAEHAKVKAQSVKGQESSNSAGYRHGRAEGENIRLQEGVGGVSNQKRLGS